MDGYVQETHLVNLIYIYIKKKTRSYFNKSKKTINKAF